MRDSWDTYFMNLAWAAAVRSTCPRLNVGAVIVSQSNHILSTGYNGSLPGGDHCSDVGCDLQANSCKRTIHAEDNALRRTTRRERSGSRLYCSHIPCEDCSNLILHKGIIEVIFDTPYKDYVERMKPLYDYHGVVLRRHTVATEEEVL